jgi:hypothetical protein
METEHSGHDRHGKQPAAQNDGPRQISHASLADSIGQQHHAQSASRMSHHSGHRYDVMRDEPNEIRTEPSPKRLLSIGRTLACSPHQEAGKTIISYVTALLYRVPEIVTRGRFPDGGESDSTWRTQEARHVGSDTIAPGF